MTEPLSERESEHHPLAQVQNGMKVYDQHGSEVGTVERVYLGLPPALQGAGNSAQIEAIDQAVFGGDRLPEMLRTHLLEHGFIRVDSARLRAADRYLMPEQIDRIEGDRVYLRIPLDKTIQA